ncbi:AAA family ATPase [Vibrio rarus]|uniref:AAA family ATPase n=1 Tax=Vibrio rarus TaxID=413403 RepID=UPI0021C26811|nr:AAA family ATPase [Vibrio rarus]
MKLRKIDIQAFRAYCCPGDGLFDFTNEDDSTSNFIALYAPNGFGKTSFYDAIEWGFTNSVSRLKKDGKKLLPFAKSIEDDKFIIRNKHANENVYSKVDIYLEGQVPPISNTLDHNKIRKGQKDTKFADSEVRDNQEFITDVILSQDGINSFLREDDAKIRYEKFIKKFGDIELSEQYKNLQKLFEISKNEEKDLCNNIKNLESKVDKNIDLNFIDKINEQLGTLDKEYNSLDAIPYTYTEEDLFNYDSSLLNGEGKIDSDITALNNIVSNLESMFSEDNHFTVSEYISNKNEIARQHLSIKNIESEISTMNKLITLEESRDIVHKHLAQDKHKLSILNSILSRYDDYIGSKERISILDDKKNSIQSKKERIKISLNSQKSNVIQFDKRIKEIFKDLDTSSRALEESQHMYAQLSEFNKELKYHKSNLRALNSSAKDNIPKEQSLLKKKNSLTSSLYFLDSEYYEQIQSFILTEEQSKILETVLSLSKKITKIGQSIDNFQEKLVFDTRLEERVQEVKTEAIKILKESNSCSCPVCSTNFDSPDSIIDSIISIKDSNVRNYELSKKLSILSSDQAELKNQLQDQIKTLKQSINKELIKLEENIFEIHQSNIKLSFDVDQETSRINEINAEIEKIRECNGQLSRDDYERKLNARLDNLSDELNQLRRSDDNARIKIESYEEEITQAEVALGKIAYELESLSRSDIVSVQESDYNKLSLNHSIRKNELNRLIRVSNESIHCSNDDVYSYNQEISVLDVEGSQEKLESLIKKMQLYTSKVTKLTSINYHIESVISSELGIEVLPGTQNLIESLLSKALQDRKHQISRLTQTKHEFSTVRHYLKNAQQYLELVQVNKDIDSLKVRLYFVTTVIQANIEKEINAVSSYIDKSIGSFFYEDLINELYRRVDPHPEYVKIRFVCNFSPREKPELHLVCTKENEESVIVPSLYFSSGQLNALSLCIFLAKALNVADGEGENVDFILIDDPVQAMDGLNILSTIDLLRGISLSHNKQVILSTHDESLFNLLKKKVPQSVFGSKFFSLESHGKVAQLAS